MVFCWCPPGRFTIGSPAGERERRGDEPQADVEFPQGFWMAKYELTRAEEKALIGLRKGSPIGDNGHKLHPVSTVVGHRKAPIAEILSALDATAPAGWTYDLPTEAEWEYAARAGTTTAYWFGDDPAELRSHGNFADRSLRESDSTGMRPLVAEKETGLFTYAHKTWSDGHVTAAIVGSLPANPWGLHDMHGNVSELTATYHHPLRLPTDAFCVKAPPTQLVLRGGSWLSTYATCRSAARSVRAEPYMPGDTVWTSALDAHQGMRLVIRPPETVAAVERGCTTFVPVSCDCSGGSTAAIGSDGIVVVSGTTSDDTYTLAGVVPEGSPLEAVKLELFPGEELPRGGPGRGPTGMVVIAEITAAFGAPGLQDATIPVQWLPPTAAGRKGVGISANAVDGSPQTAWTVVGGSSDTAAVFHIVPPSRQGADGARWRNLAPAGSATTTSAELPQPKAPIVVTMRFGNKAAPARFRLSFIRE
ncbi:MAG: formylglycine-generating enzyme family protein [Pirellulales bacterium]